MAENVEATYKIAARALDSLRRVGVSAAPRNYELWFTHEEGLTPALSRDLQRCVSADQPISEEEVAEIYNRHIGKADISKDVLSLVERFQAAIARITDAVETSGESNSGAAQELAVLSKELKSASSQHPALSSLVDGVLAVTETISQNTTRLERELERSCDEVARLRESVETVQKEAMLDPLTGVNNRKSFDISLEEMVTTALANKENLALIFADVDHFKKFNDTWGHQTGDQVLRLVADVMKANLKGKDVLARYGGEEFAIILPDTSLENAVMLADRIRISIEGRRLKKRRTNADLGTITMSMGVAKLNRRDTPETFVERADALLYTSKNAGRNCVSAEQADVRAVGAA